MRAWLRSVLPALVWLVACRDAAGAVHAEAVPASEAPTRPKLPNVSLTFVRHGQPGRALTLDALAKACPPRIVDTDDPYYGTRKRFRALELDAVLEHAFGVDVASLRKESFILRALDGYAVPVAGERLLEGGAYLAFDDADVPGFAPIGPQQVSPAPSYLVWTKPGQGAPETHPRPWQLSSIEIAPLEVSYPHIAPKGVAGEDAAWHGYAVFTAHCIKCHAINREGGRVGPDLNVPRSIVEYRPAQQIRAFIRDPAAFRYGAMPAHPHLSEADLDGLLAYFGAMAQRKHDPDAKAGP